MTLHKLVSHSLTLKQHSLSVCSKTSVLTGSCFLKLLNRPQTVATKTGDPCRGFDLFQDCFTGGRGVPPPAQYSGANLLVKTLDEVAYRLGYRIQRAVDT